MTDLQIMALCFPVALVILVGATVFIEELFNQAEMKREKAAALQPVPAGYTGSMTIELQQGDIKKLLNNIDDTAKRRAS
ncbi:MAG: hypothetical protein JWR49_3806 [Tardiphaga sp.]|jgi:hypothetical protein|nr:hypothetical protein [Tardiphaga sp.]